MAFEEDILIIGAGAAGLMAARELSRNGNAVTVLEARDRLGGRIHTLSEDVFPDHAEAGAEFIHGDLPLTLGLLKEGEIPFHETGGKTWRSTPSSPGNSFDQGPAWETFENQLRELDNDLTILDFLNKYFPADQFAGLRASVIGFASGFDTADPAKASAKALREEWSGMEQGGHSYRIEGGYSRMIALLAKESRALAVKIHLSSVVQTIQWEKGQVQAVTIDGRTFEAHKVLITVPPGVLGSSGQEGFIRFSPQIADHLSALQDIGYGAVIKVLFQFRESFWTDASRMKKLGAPGKGVGMIFSSEAIPTWWTQNPIDSTLLTGWLGGPAAKRLAQAEDSAILEMALKSLSTIFQIDEKILSGMIRSELVLNWTADPFARGSYSYDTVSSDRARKALVKPVEDTLFFAGEALYQGPHMGTVEAALQSAIEASRRIISRH